MPTLLFPDPDSLRLALASGVVPAAVSAAPGRAGIDPRGRIWLHTDAALPRETLAGLTRFGVRVLGSSAVELTEPVTDWHQLLPLQPAPEPVAPYRRIIVEVPGRELPGLTAELRRQGNTSYAVCWADGRSLVRIDNPPPFTAARFAEPCPVYAEQAPGVWVARGWRHPAAAQVRPPRGSLLLLRPPREWAPVAKSDFREEPASYPLPRAPSAARGERARPARLPQTLRLAPAADGAAAELWVLDGPAPERLAELAAGWDERLLARLSVAVVRRPEGAAVLLRAQRGKGAPPVLVGAGVAYRPYLKLPNLFLPCGLGLRPGVRRDVLRRRFARDPARLVWLAPLAGGGFRVESVAADAFRPLAEGVVYEAPAAARARGGWAPGGAFEPEPFREEDFPGPAARGGARAGAEEAAGVGEGGRWRDWLRRPFGWLRSIPSVFRTPESPAPEPGPPVPGPEEEPEEFREKPMARPLPDELAGGPARWRQRREELQARFLDGLGGLSARQRAELWPELAALYARGNNFPDAAVCWLNALWDQERPLPLWAWGWLRAEARGVRVVLPDGGPPAGPDAAAVVPLRQWLGAPPAPGPARALAAFAVWAALQPEVPARLGELLGPLQRYLEASEPWLPVRAAWMARASLARLSGGDVLSLAQARDRIVARLREHGFSLDLDVPSFLRFAAGGVSERFQAVRDWLLRVRDPLRRRIEAMVGGGARERQWSAAPVGVGDSTAGGVGRLQRFGLEPELPCTRAYADLMLAWGLARLGEHHASAGWVRQAAEVLSLGDPVHAFLLAAFEYRIRQVQEGRPPRGPLPAGLLAGLAAMPDDARYKIDKLRERSRILEPSEAVDAFRGAVFRYLPEAGELRRALLALPDVTDGPLLAERARRLLEAAAQFGPAARAEAVAGVLDLAPRAGEEVALLALRDAAAVLDAAPPALRARLVERGLAVAADLGQAAAARDLAHRLPELIAEMLPPRPPDATLARMEGVARSVFRSLRRLGMTDETDALLRQVEARLPRAAEGAAPSADPAALRVLLCLSSAWFSRGRTPRAMALLDEARTLLFTGKLPPAEQTALALAYAAALGQAGVRVALGRLEELFQRLRRVEVVGTTNSHYTLKVLELIDTAVRSVADGDFTPGPSVRAWLDSEEFLTRRRIDRDLQALMEAQGV